MFLCHICLLAISEMDVSFIPFCVNRANAAISRESLFLLFLIIQFAHTKSPSPLFNGCCLNDKFHFTIHRAVNAAETLIIFSNFTNGFQTVNQNLDILFIRVIDFSIPSLLNSLMPSANFLLPSFSFYHSLYPVYQHLLTIFRQHSLRICFPLSNFFTPLPTVLMLFFNVFPDFTSFFDALFNFLLFFASVSPPSFSVFTLETNVGMLVFNFVEASVKVEEFADNLSKLSITVATLPDTFSAPTFKSPVVEVACFIA